MDNVVYLISSWYVRSYPIRQIFVHWREYYVSFCYAAPKYSYNKYFFKSLGHFIRCVVCSFLFDRFTLAVFSYFFLQDEALCRLLQLV
jgi:hypothetical protein